MYPVSDEYLEKIQAREVDLSLGSWRGMIVVSSSSYDFGGDEVESEEDTYYFSASDLSEGGTSIRRELGAGEMMGIGGTCAAELTMKLKLTQDGTSYYFNGKEIDTYRLYNALIVINFTLVLDMTTEVVPCGKFYVTEAKRVNDTIELTAYDNMLRFERKLGSVAWDKNTPYYHLLNSVSHIGGVSIATPKETIDAMPNGGYELELPFSSTLTYREILSDIGEILCANMMIDREGNLLVMPFTSKPIRNVGTSFRYTSEIADFKTRYSSIYVAPSDSFSEISIDTGAEGLELEISGNLFLSKSNSRSICHSMAVNIIYGISNSSYVPYEITCPIDPSFDLLDNIAVSGAILPGRGPITSIEMSVGGGMTIKSVGSNPRFAKTTSRLSNAVSKVETGAVGGGSGSGNARYYHYENESAIFVTDGDTKQLAIEINYAASADNHIDFHGEIKYELETTETDDGDVITNTDGVITVTYIRDGVEISRYAPVETMPDGSHILNLLYFWFADSDIQNGKFEVYLSANGGNVTVQPYAARGYLCCRINSPESELEIDELNVTENGVYEPEEGHAYGKVTANVPEIVLNPLSITKNGTYEPEENQGFGTVTVNVEGRDFGWGYDAYGKAMESISNGDSIYIKPIMPINDPEHAINTWISGITLPVGGYSLSSRETGQKLSLDGKYLYSYAYRLEVVSGVARRKYLPVQIDTDPGIRTYDRHDWVGTETSSLRTTYDIAPHIVDVQYTDYAIVAYYDGGSSCDLAVIEAGSGSVVIETSTLNQIYYALSGKSILFGTKAFIRAFYYVSPCYRLYCIDIETGEAEYTEFDIEYVDAVPISETNGYCSKSSGEIYTYTFVKNGHASIDETVAKVGNNPGLLWDNRKYLYVEDAASTMMYKIHQDDNGTWQKEETVEVGTYRTFPQSPDPVKSMRDSYFDKYGTWGIVLSPCFGNKTYWYDAEQNSLSEFDSAQTFDVSVTTHPVVAPDFFIYSGTVINVNSYGIYKANAHLHENYPLGYSQLEIAYKSVDKVKILFD